MPEKIELSEHNIQSEIRIALSAYGIVLRNNTGTFYQGKISSNPYSGDKILTHIRPVKCGVTGMSDLVFLGNDGQVCYIEVKDAKGTATKEQLNFIKIMNERGIRSGIARSVEDALKIIKQEEESNVTENHESNHQKGL